VWEVLIGLGIRVALLYAGIRIFLWARRLKNASGTAWRRRVGLVFFLAPILLWLGQLVLPEALLVPLTLLVSVHEGMQLVLAGLLDAVEHSLGQLWLVALSPLCYALVYGVAGVLVGWPIDALRRRGRASTGGTMPPETCDDGDVGGESASAPAV
jgi:hypothetical protein